MNKREFYSLVKSVPKAELHLHGEAVISNKTVKQLYKSRYGKVMPKEELDKLFTYDDLPGFLASFIAIQNYFVNIQDIKYVLSDFADYLKKNNIVYCETFFAPTSLMRNGFDFNELLSHIDEGIADAKKRLNATVKVIVDVSRTFGLENAQHNLDLVLAAKDPNIIGIGLGGDEAKGPARDYEQVFIRAEKEGLHRVAHAGETVDSWSMKDCINLLHAERIGHGISAAYDPDFMKELAASKLPLEVSPTSNVFTKHYVKRFEDHPIKKLHDEGVFVTLNTDDPTFFKVSLLDEYWNIYHKLHFSLDDIKQVIKNGFTASFMPQEEKQRYLAQVDAAWDQWFKENPQA